MQKGRTLSENNGVQMFWFMWERGWRDLLKVPKCEIFNCSDLPDFDTIKPFWVCDFVTKI
jgi:hypothetical protein